MTIESEIAAVPKKYWLIGGGALLLIFLYLRKRGQDRAAAASSATDGLIGALQLPGGLQYAPITGWGGGGTGNNQDSGLPPVTANQLLLGDVASGTAGIVPVTAATIPGKTPVQPSNQPTAPATETQTWNSLPVNLVSWINWASPGELERQKAWIDSHPASLTTPGPDNATIFRTVPLPVNLANNSTATTNNSTSAASNSPLSNAEIFSFYSAHQNDTAALKAAMQQYNISPQQALAANVPLNVVTSISS
jgi:hypothetical protein